MIQNYIYNNDDNDHRCTYRYIREQAFFKAHIHVHYKTTCWKTSLFKRIYDKYTHLPRFL